MSDLGERRPEIEKLLPFWVNGTLSDAERDLVESGLEADSDLRKEVEFLKAIRDAVRSQDSERSPGELGLARLRRDIERDRHRDPAPRQSKYQYVVLAASAVLALVSGIAFYLSRYDEPIFIQASGEGPDAVLTVAFQAEATVEQISRILLEHDLIVVDGPSALQLYKIRAGDGEDLQAVAAELRQMTSIVSFVEVPK